MIISGIVAEYNPLHKGHVYHISKTREITNSDAIICIMSGNYVQRGIPAIIDKWSRTKIALENGVDLVLELPALYSLSSAEFFSFGAVSLLNSLGVVDNICFGSESGNASLLFKIAQILSEEPDDFKKILKKFLNEGYAFPNARSKALYEYMKNIDLIGNSEGFEKLISSSNNILGIEYCKSLVRMKSNIKAYSVKREGGSYNSNELDEVYSSATSIRKFLKSDKNVEELREHLPDTTFNFLDQFSKKGYEFASEESMLPYIKYKYLIGKESIKNLPDVSEGLHNRIYKAFDTYDNYNEIISYIKSKRYTYTRIGRILCQYFVGFENFDTQYLRSLPSPYGRILGFNRRGTEILKLIKKNSNIPIYNKLPKIICPTLEIDLNATRTYSLINKNVRANDDYLISPIVKE